MSLSKKICLRTDSQNTHSFSDCGLNEFESKEDNYRRDSFDDRFCDDLCEDILQYLSLEDKLRFECVSKQFQRTVFQRQYELYIKVQTLDSIKVVLKKCPNITSIFFDGRQVNDKVNKVFKLVVENCNNLSEIDLSEVINDSNLQEFYRKFGTTIKSVGSYIQDFIDLNRFPNIEEVWITYLYDHSIIAQWKLAKLKQLIIVFGLDHDEENMLKLFIDKFPTLKHLIVCVDSSDENAIYKSLKNISNLKHLIHFGFFNSGKINKTFCDLLKQMANNCQNLKNIDCSFFNINDQKTDIRQLLSQLKAFPALKRLSLDLISIDNEGEDNIDVNQLFSFELFKGFENITHLSLSFGRTQQTLKESILKKIDSYLPKLQYLQITNTFDTTPERVTQMAEILSRLSRLQTLKLEFKSGVDFKPIEEQITKKCRKIKEINIQTFK